MINKNDTFEERWKRFETNVHAKLLVRMKTQPLTFISANLALKDASANWFTPYDIDGAWLIQLCKDEPVKGEAVKTILKNEMKFIKEVKPKEMSKAVTYGVPIAASVLSGGITHAIGAGLIKQAVALILPSAVLFPVMKTTEKNVNGQGKKDIVKDYLEQLAVFKQGIINVLSD